MSDLKEERKNEKVVMIRFCSKSRGMAFVEQPQRLYAGWTYQQWEETGGDHSPESKIPRDFSFYGIKCT